jgi:hypothetical protein
MFILDKASIFLLMYLKGFSQGPLRYLYGQILYQIYTVVPWRNRLHSIRKLKRCYCGLRPIESNLESETNKSNCQFWKDSTYDWLVYNPSQDMKGAVFVTLWLKIRYEVLLEIERLTPHKKIFYQVIVEILCTSWRQRAFSWWQNKMDSFRHRSSSPMGEISRCTSYVKP